MKKRRDILGNRNLEHKDVDISNPELPIGEAGAKFSWTDVVGDKVGKKIKWFQEEIEIIISLGIKVVGFGNLYTCISDHWCLWASMTLLPI